MVERAQDWHRWVDFHRLLAGWAVQKGEAYAEGVPFVIYKSSDALGVEHMVITDANARCISQYSETTYAALVGRSRWYFSL